MPLIRVLSAIQGKTGLTTDQYVNNIYLDGPALDDTTGAAIVAGLETFYSYDPPASGDFPMSFFMSPETHGETVHVKLYDLADPLHSPPRFTGSFVMPTPSSPGTPFPAEVQCCLSFEGFPVLGKLQRRRRGRIYVGPLSSNSNQFSDGAGSSRPSDGLLRSIRECAVNTAGIWAALGYFWCVYSKRSGVEARCTVADFSVDDAFDIQRSRGNSPTARYHTSAPSALLGHSAGGTIIPG